MAQQTSRLHRLLTLLDTGSTSSTRRTAARQIGDIAKQHRGELRPLLRRVRQYLRSKSWDTRVAAAQAIGAIAENVPHLTVRDLLASAELGKEDDLERILETLIYLENEDGALTFRRFDMQGVLENGAQLLSSGGQEYDVGVDNSKTPAERLARQKHNLRRRLGLDGCEQFMDVNDMIRDEDLLGHRGSSTGNGEASARDFFAPPPPKQEVHELVATMVPGGLSRTLSARERNMLKRKAKVLPKDGAKEWGEEEENEEPVSKRTKPMKSVISEQPQGGDTKLVVDVVLDDENQERDADGEWPFNHIVELLIHDMFDPVWEVRHGSLMALREILSVQAASAGVISLALESESESESDAEAVSNNLPALENKESEKEISYSSPHKESMIDLNVGISSEEENGEFKKSTENSSPAPQNDKWVGVPEVVSDWMKVGQQVVKTELSLGGNKAGTKLNHFKPEGLDALKSELNLDLGKSEGLTASKPELNLDLGLVKPELSLGVVKQELGLDLNMEVELDLNMEVKDEPVIPKEEQLALKEEAVAVKEETKQESELQSNLFWQPHVPARVIRDSNESKAVTAAKKAWAANIEFLQDCTIRLLCVFALDRFGDYVSDQVVAPVRETCAQVMGAVMKQMPPALVHESLNIMLQMQSRPEWEVRHGSLLGIKYLVAVRQEMLQELLPRVLPACMAGLEDADDDVRAVAAEALTPAAAAIVASAGSKNVTAILLSLWDILLDLDDLSPSTSSVMHLLSELYSQPQVDSQTVVEKPMLLDLNETMMDDHSLGDGAAGAEDDPFLLSTLAPRLWPFMRHNITSVRLASVRTLERLLESGDHGEKADTRSSWALPILGDALRMVFQNLLLESDDTVIQCSQRVWRLLLQCPEANLAEQATAYLSSWLKLASTAAGAPLESSKMYSPNSLPRRSRGRAVAKLKAVRGGTPATGEPSWTPPRPSKVREQSSVVVGADGEKSAVHMRVTTAKALGILAASLPSSLFPTVASYLTELLSSLSGTQRQVAAMVIVSWFKEIRSQDALEKSSEAAKAVQPVLHRLLELLGSGDPSSPTPGSNAPYAELSRMLAKMRTEAGALVKHTESVGTFKRSLLASLPSTDAISAEAAVDLATKLSQPSQAHAGDADDKSTSASDAMESARQRLLATAGYLQVVQGNVHMSVLASLASAVVWMGELPVKLNPVIQPLMAAIKREQEESLQQPAAEALAEVIVQCVGRKPSPNEKLIKNLCTLTCADPIETPKATQTNAITITPEELEMPSSGKGNKHGKLPPLSATDERARAEGAITRRGAELALKSLSHKFGSSLLDQLPKLWDCLTESLGQPVPTSIEQPSVTLPVLTAESQALITNLQMVRSIAPVVDRALHPRTLTLLPAIFTCVRHDHAAVRLVASRCLTAMAQTMLEPVMASVVTTAVPMLGDIVSDEARQGAGMLITALVEGLGTDLVAYAPLLIVPLLGCMSDSNHHVRQSVTSSFAALVPLLPLARGLPPPKGLDGCQASRSAEDTRFLEQLLDNTQVDDYKLLVPLKVTLRRYQQEGINWLAFLKRFKLHGILCDDMGLGKTLQASAIVASDTVERANSFAVSKSPDVAPLPSLVVCPSTLVGHWAYEIEKFIPGDVLNPLQYAGSPQERVNLRSRFPKHNVIIASYDVLRKDIDVLAQHVWNYCILDEGHIIKSAKSKITLAAKRIQADHRLLLSGTPIQNNVLELWSLFDFLMPGFLGTERQFQSNYGKPLQAAKEGKCSSKESEAGVLAMEALHKQVMPFLLRRTKDEVLADLPPKIIQDRYCDLSPLQLQLYEDFSHSQAKQEVSTLVQTYGGPDVPEVRATSPPSTHVFQALQYLRKLCSHPLLVLDDEKQAARHADAIAQSGSKDLHELQHAPKLQALRDILEECGIGMNASTSASAAETSVGTEGGQHRVLVFAQLKSFLDIIEKDLFQTHMKGVTYLRLDGSVESDRRFDIVKAFNSDPTIDVLLLTTHVGGLGLNLTAADTVVFMEHDWNPMRDLQAMDRAHRLGQKRVVNVHRLIMRGTLEEKIMSLQRFKISVANTVINAENVSLNTMDTTQLLDLFTVSGNAGKGGNSKKGEDESEAAASLGANKGLKTILNNLEELWDQSQYTEEYNLGQFVARLNG